MHILFIMLSLFVSAQSFATDYQTIAQAYAPIVYQGVGTVPEADEFTRVDYDGDWNPNNNWDNMTKFKRPRVVYWDVIETDTSFYVTYSFFFPRDYAPICFFMHCHENDFEGMRVTVKKPSEIFKVEGLAHNFKSEVLKPKQVEITIEKEGHGIHPHSLRTPDEKFVRYNPSDYELRPLKEIWDHRNSGIFTGEFEYNGKKYPKNFGGNKWLLFGIGAAKPSWSWEIWKSDYEKGQWFLDPAFGTKEKYLHSDF